MNTRYPIDSWTECFDSLRAQAQRLYGERYVSGHMFRIIIAEDGREREDPFLVEGAGSQLVIARILGVLDEPNEVEVGYDIAARIAAGGTFLKGSTVWTVIAAQTDPTLWTRYFFEHAADEKDNPGNHPAIRALMDVCQNGGGLSLTII